MLVFENNEEIDVRGITTFGTSVKNNSNAIGYFGTGLKYAIAVCLRLGFSIEIWSGTKRWNFYTKDIKIRNGDFKLICMKEDGDESPEVELSFTTELGKNWKAWQAYRELFCNAQDEGGTTSMWEDESMDDAGDEGKTKIIVWGMDDIHATSDSFILRTEPKFDLSYLECHQKRPGEKGAVFYRGIKVYEPQQPMVYNYNMKHSVVLSEDRGMANIYQFHYALMRSIVHAQVAEVVEKVLTCGEGFFEHKLDFNDIEGEDPGQVFLAVMGTLKKAQVSHSAYGFYSGYAMENLSHLPRSPLTRAQSKKLTAAKKLLRPCGWKDVFSVVMTDMLNEGSLSKAGNNTIFLNPVAFDKSAKELAEILLDNFAQLKQPQGESRQWLIKQLITIANKKEKDDEERRAA